MKNPTLYIIGTPLIESEALTSRAIETLKSCEVIIGESKPVTDRYLKKVDLTAERFHLDPPRKDEWELLVENLQKISKTEGKAALLSDVGMPILFDPGNEVLDLCRKLGFKIKSVPGPTSWASACSISGWQPPFLIQGFLNRDDKKRKEEIKSIKNSKAHVVLMETPYRFRKLLTQLIEELGKDALAFLAWEIAGENEEYYWGTLQEITNFATSQTLEKGEFVLLLRAKLGVK